jgi:4-hydroxybenzoate polyprenyltransferase
MTEGLAPVGDDRGGSPGQRVAPALVVALEHCFLKTDLWIEQLLSPCEGRWPASLMRRLPGGNRRSPASRLDPATLPYNTRLLDYLRAERARGRQIVLTTAGDRLLAEAIATHLGCFDAVIASESKGELSGGARKVAAITGRLQGEPFSYAGNRRSDLPVWRAAKSAVLVNAAPRLVRAARRVTQVEAVIDDRAPVLKGLVRALRPHQWVKNVLVFLPIVASGQFGDQRGWLAALLVFAAFCAIASANYVVNDLADLSADRQHPRKRLRPFASGAASPVAGLALAAGLFALGFSLASIADTLLLAAFYALLTLGYTFYLKRRPLVDVFALSLLYNVRVLAGGEASAHRATPWLLGFGFFFFLSLALIKRVAELSQSSAGAGERVSRRGYYADDGSMLALMGVASAFTSALVLALYLESGADAIYASPGMLLPVVPLLLFWQCRLWLSTHRGYMHDDPIVYSAKDWVSWIFAGAVATLVLLAHRPGLSLF